MKDSARKIFPQELLNRVDSFLLFKALTPNNIGRIITRQIDEKNANAKKNGRKLQLRFPPDEIAKLVAKSYRQEEGARQIQKFVQANFINASAKEILARGKSGGVVSATFDPETNDFSWTITDYEE